MKSNWQSHSIEALENQSYGNPLDAPTALTQKCRQYVKLSVNTLSIEQLRLLIGQEIGLPYLIPLALNVLEKDILAEGDFYPGDLLKNVIGIDGLFWKNNPELFARLKNVLEKSGDEIDQAGLKIIIS